MTCVPSKFDSGDLSCISKKNEAIYTDSIRRRRTVSLNAKDESKIAATIDELKIVEAEFGGVLSDWRNLVPNIVGCHASISGAD